MIRPHFQERSSARLQERSSAVLPTLLLVLLLVPMLCSCAARTSAAKDPAEVQLLDASAFRAGVNGRETSLYTLRGGRLIMQVTDFGARVVSLWTPDRNGVMGDVATGYESIERYINNDGERFLGACVGPVANRIGKGEFTLDGESCSTPLNNDGNTLHGGFEGLDMIVWDVEELTDSSITFTTVHPDMKEGWPGNLSIRMTYLLTVADEFRISYSAVTDKATPVNISNHTFFNLTGDSSRSILDHELTIFASHSTVVDRKLIPTGEIVPLDGSPLDFRVPKTIGKDIYANDHQLDCGRGYDHNWCLDASAVGGINFAARLFEPGSGRMMEVYTDQPGLQFYCGNFFDGKSVDKYGRPIGYRCSLAMETQKWPDGINHPDFPDTVLRPGEEYSHTCIYRFSAL